MKKFRDFKFLILASTCITNFKQKRDDIEENNDFVLKILTKKRKK